MVTRSRVVFVVVVAMCVVAFICWHGRGDKAPAPTTVGPPHRGVHIVPRPRAIAIAANLRRLVGRTRAIGDRPIAAAAVTLDDTRTTTSEDDGTFSFDDVGPGDHHLTASKGAAYGEIVVSPRDRVEITLTIGPTLTVHVVDRTGRPVPDAHVRANYTQVTDRDGNATFRDTYTPSADLQISAAGYRSREVSVAVGDDPERHVEKTVTLQPGVRIGGVVIDHDGKPVAGAEIYSRIDEPHWIEIGASDAQGRWTIDGLGPGLVDLEASTDLDVPVPGPLLNLGTHPRLDLVLRVEPGATVGGVVVDVAGTPLAGVHVSASPGHDVDSDAQGRFLIGGVRAGRVYLDAQLDTLGTPTQILAVSRRGHAEVRVKMVETIIAGAVVNKRGDPVVGALVMMDGPIDGDSQGRSADTDDAGRFQFQGIPPGHYRLAAGRHAPGPVDFTPDLIVQTGRRDLVFTLPEVASIRGRVVQDGKPVKFFGVIATAAPGADDTPVPQHTQDGSFELSDVKTGTVSVVLVGPSFARHVIDGVVIAADRQTDLGDIAVSAGRTVHGHVVDASGAPIARAAVVVQHDRSFATTARLDSAARGARSADSDATGAFAIVGLPDDMSGLSIQAQDHEHGLATPRALTATDLAHDVEIVLAATGSVSGTVVDEPPGYIWHIVTATAVAGGHSYAATTNAGQFAIPQLAPGDYIATLDHYVAAPVPFHIDANRTTTVAVFRPAAVVEVSVTITGGPCTGVTIGSADGSGSWIASAPCIDTTRAAIENVVPGRYQLCAAQCAVVDIAATPEVQHVELSAVPPADR